MKWCYNCNRVLFEKEFWHSKRNKDGFASKCISCSKNYMKTYRPIYLQRPEVIEYIKQKKKEYSKRPEVRERKRMKSLEYSHRPEIMERDFKYRKTPEYKKRKKESYAKWLENPKIQEQLKKYRNDYYNRPDVKKRVKEFIKLNPDKVKMWDRNHRNKRKQLGVAFLFDNPFPEEIEIDYHHFNRMLMIPMPRITHRFINGHHKDITDHLNHNKKWIEKIYNLDVDSLIRGELGDTRLFENSRINIKEDMGDS